MPDETDEEQYQRGLALQRDGRFGEAVEVYLPLASRVLTVKLATNLGIALTEFGGIAYGGEEEGWGYSRAATPDDFLARYEALLAAVHSVPLAGFCYTQLTDTEQDRVVAALEAALWAQGLR